MSKCSHRGEKKANPGLQENNVSEEEVQPSPFPIVLPPPCLFSLLEDLSSCYSPPPRPSPVWNNSRLAWACHLSNRAFKKGYLKTNETNKTPGDNTFPLGNLLEQFLSTGRRQQQLWRPGWNTFLPAWVGMWFTSGVIPNQLPAAVVCTGVLIVPNTVTFLQGKTRTFNALWRDNKHPSLISVAAWGLSIYWGNNLIQDKITIQI